MKAVIKFLFTLVVLLVVGVAAALYFMPINKYLEKAIMDYAKAEGLPPLTFKITELSHTHTIISDVVLGEPPALTIKKIEIPYDIAELLEKKRVKLIVVDQPSLLGDIKDNGLLTFGALDQVVEKYSSGEGAGAIAPPFEAIKIALGSASIKVAGGLAQVEDINFTYRGSEEILKKELSEKQWKLELSRIDMQQFLNIMHMGEAVTAKGSFSGTLPIMYNKEKIIIRNGVLKSLEGGVIQYASSELAALEAGGEQAALVANVLKNLNFTSVDFAINSDQKDSAKLLIAMHVVGSNPNVENGRPVDLTLNLSGNLLELVQNSIRIFELPEEMAKEIHEKH